ncbi:uncharacterized protein LOC133825885 [Humulus lupulus]|uniref:uncharacterized protein LOC133825885 n=1 Tax=Humulus lupulus TaxID=3486 RepID=UPI002B40D39F|nr:uncharacterized protein LOC133825885 [Humulus lupulus]
MEDTKMIRSHETEDSNTTHQKLEAGNQSQPEIRIQMCDLDDDTKFLDQFKGKSNSNPEMANSTTNEAPKGIGWLPPILLQNNQDFVNTYCYPRELPIGPIYYNKCFKVLGSDQNSKEQSIPARLVRLSEKFNKKYALKIKMATVFIQEYFSDQNEGEENALKKINDGIKNIRAAIHTAIDASNEHSLIENEKLARLLFLDGCTILQFIRSYILDELLQKFHIDGHQKKVIAEDLFLLQNQMPLKVIIELLSNVNNVDKQRELIGYIASFLHMNNFTTDHSSDYGKSFCEKLLSNYPKNEPLHLLHLLYCIIRNNSSAHLSPPDARGIQNQDFRSVEELKSVGIDFEPSRGGYISFRNRCLSMKGHLKLPSIIVDDRTECKMMNLVAYEMCLPTSTSYFHGGKYYASGEQPTQYPVTSYVKFMDVLVDRGKDVKELRASRVLRNRLSSDVHAAKLFNKMGWKCFDPASDLYANVRKEMEDHCKNNWAMWIAQVRDKHFSSPWTIVALLAAVLILLLTATQTWYAIRS